MNKKIHIQGSEKDNVMDERKNGVTVQKYTISIYKICKLKLLSKTAIFYFLKCQPNIIRIWFIAEFYIHCRIVEIGCS